MRKNKLKKITCIALIIVTIILNLIACSSSTLSEANHIENAPFEVTFMDVGKADCILITIGDKSILIDTGLNSTKEEVVDKIKNKGIEEIEYLILTHMDKDHIGGADAILNEFKVKNLIQADYEKDSKQYRQYIEAIEENNMEPVLLHDNINVEINGAVINIYPALKDEYLESNDYSIIVDMEYGKYSVLFAGDAEEERLAEFIDMNDKNYTVVKIPHHGRMNSLSEEFIKSIKPSYSIITCSDEEKPDSKMIKMLDAYKVKTFMTKDGEVIMKTDGEKISISQEQKK